MKVTLKIEGPARWRRGVVARINRNLVQAELDPMIVWTDAPEHDTPVFQMVNPDEDDHPEVHALVVNLVVLAFAREAASRSERLLWESCWRG